MEYKVHKVGSYANFLVDAPTAGQAVAAYVAKFPADKNGWIVAEGGPECISSFQVVNGAIAAPGESAAADPDSALSGSASPTVTEIQWRYPALVTISFLFKVLGIIAMLVSIVFGIVFSSSSYSEGGKFAWIIMGLVGAFISWITCWGCSELIRVIVDIEANTRKNASDGSK